MSRPFAAIVLVTSALFIAVTPAAAQAPGPEDGTQHPQPEYSSITVIPSTCAIDESALNKYEVDEGTLRFKPGAIGTIVARCLPMPNRNDGIDRVLVDYHDSDAAGKGAMVVVRIKEVMPDSTVTRVTFNSNGYPCTTGGSPDCNASRFNGRTSDTILNAVNVIYPLMVEITISRDTTADVASVSMIRGTACGTDKSPACAR